MIRTKSTVKALEEEIARVRLQLAHAPTDPHRVMFLNAQLEQLQQQLQIARNQEQTQQRDE
jgi:hypothetical protein